MEIVGRTPIHPLLFISGKICGYLTWIFLILGLTGISFLQSGSTPPLRYLSFIFLAAGIMYLIVSSYYLGRSVRIGLPETMTVLKTTGIYRFSRNPMYAGFNMVTLSSMLYTFNIIVILAGIYSIIVYHLIILGEEKFLGNRFGEEYLMYKKRVRRYL